MRQIDLSNYPLMDPTDGSPLHDMKTIFARIVLERNIYVIIIYYSLIISELFVPRKSALFKEL